MRIPTATRTVAAASALLLALSYRPVPELLLPTAEAAFVYPAHRDCSTSPATRRSRNGVGSLVSVSGSFVQHDGRCPIAASTGRSTGTGTMTSSSSSRINSRSNISSRGSSSTALSMGLRSFLKRKLGRGEDASSENGGGSKNNRRKSGNSKSKKQKDKKKGRDGNEDEVDEDEDGDLPPPIRNISSDVSAPSNPPVTANSGSAVPSTIMETFFTKNKNKSKSGGRGRRGGGNDGGGSGGGRKKRIGRDDRVRSLDEPIRQALPDAEGDESVQQRIARVKAGFMSDDEKEAFLVTALSNPIPRAGDGRGGKPIRQSLPSDDDGGAGGAGDGSSGGPTDVASILANAGKRGQVQNSADSDGTGGDDGAGSSNLLLRPPLWSTIASTSPSATPTKGRASGAVDKLNEDDKRKFLDSVMNPERFKTYGVNGGIAQDSAYEAAAAAAAASREEEKSAAPSTSTDGGGGDRNVVDSKKEKKKKNKSKSGGIFSGGGGLADRLEAAAHARETADREKRERAEEEEKERMRKMEEELRAQEQELVRKLEADIQRKKAEEERIRAEAEAAEAVERERLAELQRKQDEYWASKLEEEARRREERFTAEQRAERAKAEEEEIERRQKGMERRAKEEVERTMIREEERLREDPHESEILQKAQEDELQDRKFTRAIMVDTAGLPRPTANLSDVSSSAFVNQQQQKQAEIDRVKKEQEERLRALNSPLPSPGAPPRVISPSAAPARINMPSSGQSLAQLSSLLGGQKLSSVPPSPPPAPASPLPSLAEMTRLKKNNNAAGSSSGASTSSNSGKRVVRQQLPLVGEDDVDYDGDDYVRGGPNTGMSIGDVMKNIGGKKGDQSDSSGGGDGGSQSDAEKKAMMWGIDMSKYDD